MITIASNYATTDDDARGAPLLQQKSKAGRKHKNNNDDEAEIAYTGLPIMNPTVNKDGGKGGNRSSRRGKGQKLPPKATEPQAARKGPITSIARRASRLTTQRGNAAC
jgi:hypothetical protein